MGSTSARVPVPPVLLGSKRLLALRDDEHLIRRVRAGETVAFEVLYERHLPGVLSFCRHMVGSREEAEDAVQQAFASAHRALLAGERAVNFKPWIYTIARNRCLSMLRGRREDLPEDLGQATAGLDAEVQARADLRELVADLRDLPEDQRAALLLTEIRDLSHAEVAEVLDCEARQVKGLLHRARSGLIERRDAREASCEDIRVELSAARGGGLRRGRLRHHLKACPSCSAYRDELKRQRQMLSLVLPVVPSLGLKAEVLAAIGFGGGATGGGLAAGSAAVTGAGAVAAGGGATVAATVAKVAAVAAIAGGTAGVGIAVVDSDKPSGRDSVKGPGSEPRSSGSRSGERAGSPAALATDDTVSKERPGARSRERVGAPGKAGDPSGKGSERTRAPGENDASAPGKVKPEDRATGRRGDSGRGARPGEGADKPNPGRGKSKQRRGSRGGAGAPPSQGPPAGTPPAAPPPGPDPPKQKAPNAPPKVKSPTAPPGKAQPGRGKQ